MMTTAKIWGQKKANDDHFLFKEYFYVRNLVFLVQNSIKIKTIGMYVASKRKCIEATSYYIEHRFELSMANNVSLILTIT